MILILNGSTLIGGRLVTPASGPVSADAATEANLVNRGVAQYIGTPPEAESPAEEHEDETPPGFMIVTASLDLEHGSLNDVSATLDEVIAASKAKKTILFKINLETEGVTQTITTANSEITDLGESGKMAVFSLAVIDSDSHLPEILRVYAVSGDNDGAWGVASTEVYPEFDGETDLGKMLSVTAEGLGWVTPS